MCKMNEKEAKQTKHTHTQINNNNKKRKKKAGDDDDVKIEKQTNQLKI